MAISNAAVKAEADSKVFLPFNTKIAVVVPWQNILNFKC
jgi:hypothetical protein